MKNKLFARSALALVSAVMLTQALAAPVLAGPIGASAAKPSYAEGAPDATGSWATKDGKLYRYDASGSLLTGYFKVEGSKYYAFKTGEVVQAKGWFKRDDGKSAWANENGVIKRGVVKRGKKRYYVDAEGLKKSGYFKVGKKYYFTVKGEIKDGWNTSAGKTYYVQANGALATGTVKISGQQHKFTAAGVYQGRRVTVLMNGKRYTSTIENIVAQMVAAEVEAFNAPEVYKAQAIAARSYVEYLLENEKSRLPSVVGKKPSAKVKSAVSAVQNLRLTYKGKVAFTPYGSSSNGKTNPGKSFFEGSFPYLRSKNSRFDSKAPSFEVATKVDASKFLAALDKTYGTSYSLPEDPAQWIQVTYNAQGYAVGNVVVGNKEPTVEYFYQTLMRLCIKDGLRSPAFTVAYNRERDVFTFTTKGWGHGVGMSQYGAYYYNKYNKWNYKQILSHYFPGTRISKAVK